MADLDLQAFIESLRALPRTHNIGAAVTSPQSVKLILKSIEDTYGRSAGPKFFGMTFVSCEDMDDDDVFFFETLKDAETFIEAVVMAKAANIDPKKIIRAFRREFIDRVGGSKNVRRRNQCRGSSRALRRNPGDDGDSGGK